ncbi:MAG TPA: DUF805 domain-containing protein [Thiothrix sp.]|nr:DUF805 domain-containing protein [Thiothrix sp.]
MTNPYSTPESNLQRNLNNGQNDTSSPFSPSGRFGRYSYLAWNFVINIVLMIVVGAVLAIAGATTDLLAMTDPNQAMNFYASGIGFVVIAIMLISFVITIIFFVRRLHDINMSGWWSLLSIIPLVNIIFGIFVLVKKGTEGANNFGPERVTPTWEKIVGIISLIIIVLYIILLISGMTMGLMGTRMQ